MRALVTGASGFVGPHLIDHLESSGDTVIATDRTTGTDIGDLALLSSVVADARPDVIYHLAGDADVGGSWDHPIDTFRANAEGTLNIVEAARAAGVQRLLCVGSADVYGQVSADELPLTESSPLRPTSPYAASKVAADYIALQATLGWGLETIRVRAFNHLGPGQSDRFVAPALAMRIARNERDAATEVPVGNLSPRRDITDVRDVVRAYRLLVEHGVPGEVYNVCSGRPISVQELADRLISLAARPMALVSDPDLQRPVDIPVLWGDNTKLRTATGWAPDIDIDQTLADLMADCRARVTQGG